MTGYAPDAPGIDPDDPSTLTLHDVTDGARDAGRRLPVVRPDTRLDVRPDTRSDRGPDVRPDTRPDFVVATLTDRPGWRSTAAAGGRRLVERSADRLGALARTLVFHLVRLPVYWLRLGVRVPRAVARGVRAVYEWVTDSQGRRVRAGVAATSGLGAAEAMAYHRVVEQHREAVHRRLAALAVLTVLALAAGVAGWWLLPLWPTPILACVAALVVPLLGVFGRDPAHPVLDHPFDGGAGVPPVSEALIANALEAMGITALTRGLKADGLRLVSPIHRDGPGWRADIDLPMGVPAGDVAEHRDKLAAGLRRPVSCVWPESDPDTHEARLILWVGDRPMHQTKPRPWPLADRGRVDLFAPFPLGVDQRGRTVTTCLMFASMLIGAVPRMGKTFTLRLILLAAALDDRVQLHVHDLKGGADLRPLGPVCHRFRSGSDDDDIAYLAAGLGEVQAEMDRRYAVLRSLPEAVCPEGKITPELASRRELGLHPIVVAIDECHYGFEHERLGGQLEKAATDLVKRGPAAGIILILATQRPDAKSIPPAISANAVLRFCLKVTTHQANDMVLGTGAYKAGVRATMFARSDRGVGYLAGEGDDPQIVRTAYLDAPAAKTVAARARAARHLAGRLSGYGADLDLTLDVPPDPTPTLLDDIAAVTSASEPKVWSEEILTRLVAHRPATYTGWDPAALGTALAAYGVKTIQIARRDPAGKTTNRKGIDRVTITRALAERTGHDPDHQPDHQTDDPVRGDGPRRCDDGPGAPPGRYA